MTTLADWVRLHGVPPYHDLDELRRGVTRAVGGDGLFDGRSFRNMDDREIAHEKTRRERAWRLLEMILEQPWVLPDVPAVAPESDGEGPTLEELAEGGGPHEYAPLDGDDASCAICRSPGRHDPVVADPIDMLNVLASKSVASSTVLATTIGMVEQPAGVVPWADFIPIGGLLNERAADFAMTWEMLKDDGRLPEGVRCLMAELTFALQLMACIASAWRPPAVISNPEAVAAAEAGPGDRAERRRRGRG